MAHEHPLKEGLNALEPTVWAAPLPGGQEGITQACNVSLAISAKRIADALERVAEAAETTAGEIANPEWGIAPTLRKMNFS